jgi:hypothetical protein
MDGDYLKQEDHLVAWSEDVGRKRQFFTKTGDRFKRLYWKR